MNLTNCACCGKLLLTGYEKRCRDCMQLYLEDSRKIKQFLLTHPRASVIEVCNQTGISLKRIKEVTGQSG
ncbi:hypothetical protein [Paenibacillus hamazuiensis]|uniref:hypothetical protein n=1 Tax=Paenibacillus hamazuiensis TaxID=2936508 RepID=UPI00200E4365|nr:hypothetical protein [Paenibacillus hamazuiensis]